MHGIRIGRVFGVDIRVDASWILIFLLLTWNLVALFARWHEDWTPVGAFAMAILGSLLFFVCILLHELAHSLVAIGYGTRVRSITLFLFGGVSNIEREPPSPVAELVTAIVGPATSLAIGAGALLVALVAMGPEARLATPDTAVDVFSRLGPISTLLVWLGPINIAIGLFNLVPGFPLDGGRVLRSILWSATGDLRKATHWASSTGQAIGWLFIALGIAMSFGLRVPFFGTGFVSGLWLAFIGWFLRGAAAQAWTRVELDEALAGMTVAQLMRRQGPIVTPDTTLASLVHAHLVPGDDRAVPVVVGDAIVGLVSVADVRRVAPEAWARTPVRDVMRSADQLAIATPDESLGTAFERLVVLDVEQMPVISNGRLVGMLRRRDIARWLEIGWRPAGTHDWPRHAV